MGENDFPALMDPRTLGVLSAAFQGLQASGPSMMPRSLGQIAGMAGSAGLGTYQGAYESQRKLAQSQALISMEQQKQKLAELEYEMKKRGFDLGTGLLSGLPGLSDLVGGATGAPGQPGAQGQAPAAGGMGGAMGLPGAGLTLAGGLTGLPGLSALGKMQFEASKGIAQRPNAPVVNPITGQIIAQPVPVPPAGGAIRIGPNGPEAYPIPNAAPIAAGQAAAVAGGTEAGKAPYELGTVNTEGSPTLMTRQQQIEAATGKPMVRPGFTRETPAQNKAGWDGRLRILNAELAQEQQALATAKTPEETKVAQDNIAALTKEIGSAQPKAGLKLQDQSQSAANTEAGKEFIAEMRKNYGLLRDVPATLQNIDRAKTLALGEGSRFMGPVGSWKLEATKFLRSNVPGMENLQTPAVTGAEEVRSAMFNQVMDNLKKMDAQPSQYQQMVMQDAFGTLGTDPKSLPKMLDVFGDILRTRVAIHNQTVTSAEGKGISFPYDVKINLAQKNIRRYNPATGKIE